jgi:hypothetical protein
MSWGYLEKNVEENSKVTYIGNKNVKRSSELWVGPTCREEELSLSPKRAFVHLPQKLNAKYRKNQRKIRQALSPICVKGAW